MEGGGECNDVGIMKQLQFEQSLQPFRNVVHPDPDQLLVDRMRYYGIPGVSIALIEDGTLAWARGYGVCDVTSAVPVTSDTRFPVASLTKPIVGLTVLRLVQQGVLELDVDVNQYLTSWKLSETVHTRESKVTLRYLLSHGAGISTYGFWGYRPSKPIPTLLDVLDGLPPANSTPVRVVAKPGSRWSYSSGGYCIIQQLLCDVLGQPFPQLVADLVFAPLEMRASICAMLPPPELEASCAHGHDPTGGPIAERWRAHPELASSGVWSTPSDIAKLAIGLQRARTGEAQAILSTDLAEQMFTPQISNWGLGVAIDGAGLTARFAHGGAVVGFRSALVAYIDRGQGAVVTTNGDRGEELCVEVLHSLARVYGWPEYYHYLEKQ